MADIKSIADQLVNLTVKDVSELANILKDEYGIEPAAAAVVSTSATGGGNEEEVAEEKTNFDIVLKSAGASKLGIVKLVKELTGLGLKDAKDMVDGAPKAIKGLRYKGVAKNQFAAFMEVICFNIKRLLLIAPKNICFD